MQEESIKEIPLGRKEKPEEVAKLAVFYDCFDSEYITGLVYIISGGY